MGYKVLVYKGWWDCVLRTFNQDEAGKCAARWSRLGYNSKMVYANLNAGE